MISSFLSIFEVVVYYPNDVYTVNTECFYDSIRIRESSSTIFPGLSKKNRARMLSSDCTVPPRAQLMNVLSWHKPLIFLLLCSFPRSARVISGQWTNIKNSNWCCQRFFCSLPILSSSVHISSAATMLLPSNLLVQFFKR